jgi:hypothetical protein
MILPNFCSSMAPKECSLAGMELSALYALILSHGQRKEFVSDHFKRLLCAGDHSHGR